MSDKKTEKSAQKSAVNPGTRVAAARSVRTANASVSAKGGGFKAVVQEDVSRKPKKRKDLDQADMSLNLTSMIDVIFQLLIYFVITASFSVGEGILTAKMPADGGPATETEVPERPLTINVSSLSGTTDYRISLSGYTPKSFSELSAYLKQSKEQGLYTDKTPVKIKPSPDVRWQHVVAAFNSAVAAKFTKISFASSS